MGGVEFPRSTFKKKDVFIISFYEYYCIKMNYKLKQ